MMTDARRRGAGRRTLRLAALTTLIATLLIACGTTTPPPGGGGGSGGGIAPPEGAPIEFSSTGGNDQTQFDLTNTADVALDWSLDVRYDPDGTNPQSGAWFTYQPSSGTIPAGASETLTLTLANGLADGSYRAELDVDYVGAGVSGTTSFEVLGQVGSDSGDAGFDIALGRSSLELAPGDTTSVEVTLSFEPDFTETVTVDVLEAPPGFTFGDPDDTNEDLEIVDPNPAGDGVLALEIRVPSDGESGDITVGATSESGTVQRATLALTVSASSGGSGSIRGEVTTANADISVDPPATRDDLGASCLDSVGSARLTAAPLGFGALERPAYVPGQVLVAYHDAALSLQTLRTDDGVRTETPAEARQRVAAEVRATYDLELVRDRGPGRADVLRLPESADVLDAAERLERDPRVRYAEPNWLAYPAYVPSDPCIGEAWQLPVAGFPLGWEARTASGGGSDAPVVAVVDSGIDIDHPDLQGAFVSGGYDFCDELSGGSCSARDNDVRPSDSSDQHGTHVTGVLAMRGSNGRGGAGAVPGAVRVLPVKVFRDFFTGTPIATIADGVLWASGGSVSGVPGNADPADIINLSLGFDPSNPNITDDDVTTLREAVEAAQANGALLIAAAGNYGGNALAFPARFDGVVSVGAVNSDLRRSCFTSAPGNNSGDRAEHLMAPGGDGFLSTTACDGATNEAILSTFQGGNYGLDAGTSQAAPLASGVAALVWAQQEASGSADAASVRQTLLDATWYDSGYMTRSGYGQGVLRADIALGFPGPDSEVSVSLSGPETGVDVVRLDPYGGSETYAFTELPSGSYTLEAAVGSLDATRTVDLGTDATRTADLRLAP